MKLRIRNLPERFCTNVLFIEDQPKDYEMHAELYTDGIDEIAVSGTIVRLDLVSLSPSERDVNNNPRQSFGNG